MRIAKATRKYERWLRRECDVVPADLVRKHQIMRASAFSFFRGTFYRWMQLWPDVCPVLATAPEVPAIGDLHVENFGTWRDGEGRLVWGINDFDECVPLAYTNDLVRLAASAILAAREARLSLAEGEIAAMLLKGYRLSLTAGGTPFVLEGRHHWLRHAAMGARKPAADFWLTLTSLAVATRFPRGVKDALRAALPRGAGPIVWKRRVAGVGSLGRPRIVALAPWRGSVVAREAKALLPSAARWADDDRRDKTYCAETVGHAIRSWDPTLTFRRRWIVRRLAPDCSRVELADLPRDRDERRLFTAMGAETANVHLGDPKACRAVLKHLPRLNGAWLARAARQMADAMTADWERF
jgi:hypothetical protein